MLRSNSSLTFKFVISARVRNNHLEEFRRNAYSAADTKLVMAAYHTYLKQMMRDRRCDAQLRQHAREAATLPDSPGLLSVTIDAMDMSKFKVPSKVCGAKMFAHIARPQLKLSLAVSDGLEESFHLSDPDVGR